MKKLYTFILLLLMSMNMGLRAQFIEITVDGIKYEYLESWHIAFVAEQDRNAISGDVVIPSEIEYPGGTLPVKALSDNAFNQCTNLTSIILSEGVETSGDNIFHGCTSLRSVTLPSTFYEAGSMLFYGCSSLDDLTCYAVTPPDLGPSAFTGTRAASDGILLVPEASIALYQSADQWNQWKTIDASGDVMTTINCNGVKYQILDGTAIVLRPLDSEVTVLEIPEQVNFGYNYYPVVSLGAKSFSECRQLTTLTLPSTLQTIQKNALYSCVNLKELTCRALVPPACETGAFNYVGVGLYTTLYVPQAALDLYSEAEAWRGFMSIQAYDKPDDPVDPVDPDYPVVNGFKYHLNHSDHTASLTKQDPLNFDYWEIPETIEVNGETYDVTTIEDEAFAYQNFTGTLTSTSSKLTRIGRKAFCQYRYDEPGGSINTLYHAQVNLACPNLTEIGDSAFINVHNMNWLIIKDCTSLTTLGVSCFENCYNLSQEVTLPESLVTIGSRCFWSTQIPTFHLPAHVQNVSGDCFHDCWGEDNRVTGAPYYHYLFASLPSGTNISRFTTEYGIKKVFTTITVDPANPYLYAEDGVLYNHSMTRMIRCPEARNTDMMVLENVKEIGEYCFYECRHIGQITLPWELESIKRQAFNGCQIYYDGTHNGGTWHPHAPHYLEIFSPVTFEDRALDGYDLPVWISSDEYPSHLHRARMLRGYYDRNFYVYYPYDRKTVSSYQYAASFDYTDENGDYSIPRYYPYWKVPFTNHFEDSFEFEGMEDLRDDEWYQIEWSTGSQVAVVTDNGTKKHYMQIRCWLKAGNTYSLSLKAAALGEDVSATVSVLDYWTDSWGDFIGYDFDDPNGEPFYKQVAECNNLHATPVSFGYSGLTVPKTGVYIFLIDVDTPNAGSSFALDDFTVVEGNTGITTIQGDEVPTTTYTLSGQRVAEGALAPGFYVAGGQKILVK